MTDARIVLHLDAPVDDVTTRRLQRAGFEQVDCCWWAEDTAAARMVAWAITKIRPGIISFSSTGPRVPYR